MIFFRAMWPLKLAWILAAAALAPGSSSGMSRMSSSGLEQALSWGRGKGYLCGDWAGWRDSERVGKGRSGKCRESGEKG